MSQYNNPYAGESYGSMQGPPKTSGLAIAALICGILLPPIGIILGIAALVSIRANAPAVKGTGMAVAGLILGIVLTIGCGAVGFCVNWAMGKVAAVMEAHTEWPAQTFDAGFQGDYDGFRAHFTGRAATASDQQVQEFIDALTDRYGAYQATIMVQPGQVGKPAPGQTSMPIGASIDFADQRVDVTFQFLFGDQTGSLAMKYDSVTVHDADLGDLTFPPPN